MRLIVDVDLDPNDDIEDIIEQVEEALRDSGIHATVYVEEED